MLEQTAKRYPDKIAVKHGHETITFDELNEQSTKLATFFCSKGVKEGDRIALVAEKSIKSVVSIFGVLKAGAMYVPIDPSMPKERLEYILSDCGVDIVLTSIDVFKEQWLPKQYPIPSYHLYIDINLENANTPLNIEIRKDASAYIIYTSGSTGEPKGVEIYHKSVTNLMEWYTKEFSITSEDRILSFVPFWFDASICDLFSMAKTGATLVLPSEGINIFPNEFAQFLVDEEISLFFVPSSQFVLTLDALKDLKYPKLKTVMFGAEELAVRYVRELKEVFKGCELVNIYGPTECTDIATFYKMPIQFEGMEKIPIGTSYPGILTTVINEHQEECELDEIGELLIYGPNIMKGYWNKSEETSRVLKKCIYPSWMWYHTGDLVYRDYGWNYVYVGRKDRQIKSMGRRIQLEEIEHVLNEHPLVKEAIVMSVQDANVEAHIKIECYVVPLATLLDGELIRYCRTKLPDYMVPTKVYICDTLPKLSNGKLNRNVQK
jgi:amino acid adenylation domain-containing protein